MRQPSTPKVEDPESHAAEVDASLAATGEFPHQPPEPEQSDEHRGDRKDRPSPQDTHLQGRGGRPGSKP